MRPLIGITPDEGLSPERPGRPAMPRYELKFSYPDAVLAAGGAPLVLPYAADDDVIARYLDTIRGLVVSGGAFDVSPEEYGETASAKMGPVKPVRTRFERQLLEGAIARGMPVLGVCGGMQLLNVVLGGTLVQDVGTEVPGALEHEQKHDPREAAHDVLLESGSRLARIVGRSRIGANTTHHQAVKAVGRGLVVSGRSEDGVVEAIEGTDDRVVIGVQWHPEMLADDANQSIYKSFVESTR